MRTRSLTKLAALGFAGTLALSACGSSGSSGGGLNNDGGSGGGGDATYTIAFEGPLSGDYQQLGINEVNGVQLAIDQANAKGDLGFKLKLMKADDGGDPAKAPAAAAQVLQDKTVVGVIGPSFSGATKAVGNIYGDAGMTVITPSASNPSLSTLGFKTFHRIVPNDNVEGSQAAVWLAKKAKKVYVINDLSDYGDGVANAVQEGLKKAGVKIIKQGVAGGGATKDYGTAAAAVKNSGAAAMFYAGYDADAAQLATALKAAGYKGIRIGGNGIKSSVFTDSSKKAGEGWYMSCGCLDATVAPAAKQFTADYKAAFNTDPSTYSPEAFDATNALIEAIKAAKAGGGVTLASVNEAVNALNYTGITATIKFQEDGEIVPENQVVNLFQQKGGAITLLGNILEQK